MEGLSPQKYTPQIFPKKPQKSIDISAGCGIIQKLSDSEPNMGV